MNQDLSEESCDSNMEEEKQTTDNSSNAKMSIGGK